MGVPPSSTSTPDQQPSASGAGGRLQGDGLVGPVDEVGAGGVPPVDAVVDGGLRVVLVEEVVDPVPLADAVGVVEPACGRDEVEAGAVRVGLGACDESPGAGGQGMGQFGHAEPWSSRVSRGSADSAWLAAVAGGR